MKASIAIVAATASLVHGYPQAGGYSQEIMPKRQLEWQPPGPDDVRGPCPMMNTLANHAFIPHDGRNITKENAIKGLGEGLNFGEALASLMWDQAIIANPEPNATFFTLEQLNVHNVLEHDGSLSRMDAYYGNNHLFNPEVFAQTRRYWTAETLTAEMLANSKLMRQIESRAFNPSYTFDDNVEQFSLGEMAAPFIAFGDTYNVTVSKVLVEYMFEHERLPSELGWTVKEETMTLEGILRVKDLIEDATALLTKTDNATDADSPHSKRSLFRKNLHLPIDM